MKIPQFYITVALAAICLALSIAALAYNKSVQDLSKDAQSVQTQIQGQTEALNRANGIAQHFQNLATDMANASVKNEKIRQVLAQNDIKVNAPVSATPTPAPAQ